MTHAVLTVNILYAPSRKSLSFEVVFFWWSRSFDALNSGYLLVISPGLSISERSNHPTQQGKNKINQLGKCAPSKVAST